MLKYQGKPRLTWRNALLLAMSLMLLGGCTWQDGTAEPALDRGPTLIYLVRHAEKGEGKDPDLTAQGHARARTLANTLKAQAVDRLWSSDYARTRQTLAPLSAQRNIPVTLYDAHDSEALVRAVMASPPGQTHVIAGHSNTVPALLDLIEAWPGAPDGSAPRPNLGHSVYDRLYVVTMARGQAATVRELRY